jgi:predicted nucleic acid-binding protein
MMAVSNTSPLITLAVVEQLELLPKLYSSLVIPPAVYYELTHLTDKPAARTLATVSWLLTQAVMDTALVTRLRQHLHAGEAEAIVLAIELQAPVLLMDEQRGRRIASDLGLSVTGVVGVLIAAKQQRLVPRIKPILDDMKRFSGFWLSPRLYHQVLQLVGE